MLGSVSSWGPQTVGVGEDRAAEPIGVIEPTTSERIVVAGTDIARLGEGARTAHRRAQVGFVFSSSGWYSRRPVGERAAGRRTRQRGSGGRTRQVLAQVGSASGWTGSRASLA
jgi:ABC-type lipoprotein export system ATPase subunit